MKKEMEQTPMSLDIILGIVREPRRDHGKTYPLATILYITLAGILCGAESWYEIEEFAETREEFFRQRIPNFQGVPSHDTLNRVFSLLDPKELEQGFQAWISAICKEYSGVVAIDGKEIRGAATERPDGSFERLRMVSAWGAENGICFGQEQVASKSNEITAIPRLLEVLDLKDCVVTIDAIGCQHKIVEKLVEKKTDFVIAVKENQQTLYNAAKDLFDSIDFEGNKLSGRGHIPATRYAYFRTENTGHGRHEQRHCQVFSVKGLGKTLGWEGVRGLVCQTNIRTSKKTGKSTIEKRYYITSLGLEAERIAGAIRAHWSIENQLHWHLDVTFNEDGQRKRGNAARNFSLFAKLALMQLKKEGSKGSLKGKRKRAGWDISFMTKLLDQSWSE